MYKGHKGTDKGLSVPFGIINLTYAAWVRRNQTGGFMETYNNQQLMQEFLQRISWEQEADSEGYQTSLQGLNRQTGLLQPGRCYLFVGPSASLNRAFLATLVHDLCWTQQLTTRWICCKQLAANIIPLLASCESGVAPQLLSAAENRDKVQKAAEAFQNAPLDIWETNTDTFLDDTVHHLWDTAGKQVFIVEDLNLVQFRLRDKISFLVEYARIFQSVVIVSAVISLKHYTPLNVIGKLRWLGEVDPYFDCISSLTAKECIGETTITLQNVKNRRLPCSTAEFTYTMGEMNFKDKENR